MHVRASSRDISVPPNCLSGEVDGMRARASSICARETAVYARGASAHVSVHASPPPSGRARRGKEAESRENRGTTDKRGQGVARGGRDRRLVGLYVPRHRYI